MGNPGTITPLLTRREAADFLGVKPQTLGLWHSTGRHRLPVVKVGNRCHYRLSELEKFCSRRTRLYVGDTAVAR